MIGMLFLASLARQNAVDLFDVTKSEWSVFKLHDTAGHSMDCLKMIPSSNGKKFYGIYHALSGEIFQLWLADSVDGKIWKPLRMLDEHGHQGTMAISPEGRVLLAWEKDIPGKGNHIHVALYESESQMELAGTPKNKDIDRMFSPSAEGTPSFESIAWKNPWPTFVMGFHYWRNSDVDRQAVGRMDERWNWSAVKRPEFDKLIEAYGVKGNIGDRDTYFLGRSYTVLEGMKKKGDWGTWGIYLFDSVAKTCTPIMVRTPLGSHSFANPSVTIVKNRAYISLFLPEQGNNPAEAGELLYSVRLR